MSSARQHGNNPVDDLSQWIEEAHEHCRETTGTRSTVTRTTVTHSFVAQSKIDNHFSDITILEDVLRALYPASEPFTTARNTGAWNCTRSLCILVHLKKGHYISEFVKHRTLWDEKLPFYQRPKGFPLTPEDPNLWDHFKEAQWKFCPPKLRRIDHVKLEDEEVLPILQKRQIASGVSAHLWHVVIHRDYDDLGGEQQAGQSDRHFALKTYRGRKAEAYYRNEVQNFAKLSIRPSEPAPGLIGFYGGFEHRGTYHVLLEYADGGNLEEFFEQQEPPSCGEDVVAMWRGFTDVIKALVKIHELEWDGDDKAGFKVFQGWHQDIKPKNILIHRQGALSPYESQFKLADLGLSHFSSVTREDSDPEANDTMGTRTYGAPEIHRRTDFEESLRFPARRTVDIWSLACVMLEICIWSVRGKRYLNAFRESRLRSHEHTSLSPSDCFHDGRTPKAQLLGTVTEQLHTLTQECRRSDFITWRVLEIVKRLLKPWPKERPPAQPVLSDLETAVADADAQRELSESQPHYSAATRIFRGMEEDPSHAPARRSTGVTFDLPRTQPVLGNRPFVISPQSTLSLGGPSLPPNPAAQSSNPYNYWHDLSPATNVELLSSTQHRSNSTRTTYNMTPHQRRDSSRVPTGQARPLSQAQWDSSPTGKAIRNNLPMTPFDDDHPDGSPEAMRYDVPQQPLTGEITGRAINTSPTASSPEANNTGHERSHPVSLSPPTTPTPNRSGPTPEPAAAPVIMQSYREEPPPELKLHQAVAWMNEHQNPLKRMLSGPKLENGFLRDRLKKRDHVFLIDDSHSMRDYWPNVKDVFRVLVYFATLADPNGVELKFMSASNKNRTSKSWRDLTKVVESHDPRGVTDINIRLGAILSRYREDLQDQRSRNSATMPLSIYVLTDGVWAKNHNAEGPIMETVQMLQRTGQRRSQVGIQFINFGKDEEGTRRLDKLDNLVKSMEGGLDIVDTTHYFGNVWKMLLGAIDPAFDND